MNSIILDFTADDIMNLSVVQRWGIVRMSKRQSVAEHSYIVSVLAMAIAENMYYEFDSQKRDTVQVAVQWSLLHDMPEVVTGDIPASFKRYLKLDTEMEVLFPKYCGLEHDVRHQQGFDIFFAADNLEAIKFAEAYCIDPRKDEIINAIWHRMIDYLKTAARGHDVAASMIQLGLMTSQRATIEGIMASPNTDDPLER